MNRRSSTSPTRRSGFSLMEVILATAILLGSVVVLSELAGMGRRQSLRGRDLSEAQRLCEQTMTELLTGIRPLEPQEQEPLLPRGEFAEDGFTSFDEEPLSDFADTANPFAFEEETATPDEDLLSENSQTARWLHSIRIAPLESHPGLAALTVVVEQSPEVAANPLRFQLSRWIDDPLGVEAEEGPFGSPSLDLAQGIRPIP